MADGTLEAPVENLAPEMFFEEFYFIEPQIFN